MARVATFINDLRQKKGTENVYLLDNGDILQGQPISYYYNYIDKQQENIAASVINFMHYDATTVGNHDIELDTLFTINGFANCIALYWEQILLIREHKSLTYCLIP